MATIPDASSLGGRPSLRTNRPVTQNTSAATQANAFTDFGEAAFRSGAAVQDKQDTFAINMANQAYLQLDDKVRREVQELDDYSTWDEEYKNRMAVGLEPIVSGVRGNQNQELFRERAASTVSQGSGIMFDAAFKREAIKGQADAFNALEATRETFLTTSDSRLRTTYLDHAHEIIKSAEANGYIDAAQAAEKRASLGQDYAVSWVDMQEPAMQEAILKASIDAGEAGSGTPADIIKADKKHAMWLSAQNANKVDTVRQDSQAFAAQAVEMFPDDDAAQRKWVRANVKDPETKDEAVRRIDQRSNQRASDVKALNDKTYQSVGDDVMAGKRSTDSLTQEELEILTVEQQKQLKAIESSRLAPKETDWGEWTNLKVALSTMTPEQVRAVQPMNYRLALADAEFKELLNTVTKAQNNEPYQIHNNSTAWQKMNQMTDGKMNTTAGAVLNKMFSVKAAALELEQEAPLSDEQQMDILSSVAKHVAYDSGNLFWGPNDFDKPLYKVAMKDIPDADKETIRQIILNKGGQPSDINILTIYARQLEIDQYGK